MNIIFLNKIKIGVTVAGLMFISLTTTAYARDFTQPDLRIVIDNEYEGMNYQVVDEKLYVPVRQLFETLGATVSWQESGTVVIRYNEKDYQPNFFVKDSKAMVRASAVNDIFGYSVEKVEQANVLAISKNSQSIQTSNIMNSLPTYKDYSEEDLQWLSKIIHAEANGEPYEAKIAVGSVIINRMDSPQYPDTIKSVVFDRKSGVQFTPTSNGSIYNTPSTDSYMAALEVLEGKRNADGALFFINPRYAQSSWVSRNRPFAFTMKNHDFYY